MSLLLYPFIIIVTIIEGVSSIETTWYQINDTCI